MRRGGRWLGGLHLLGVREDDDVKGGMGIISFKE